MTTIYSALSCVGENRFWIVETRGDWDQDVAQGRAIAHEVAAYLLNDGSPLILRKIMRDIDTVDGIAAGFIHGLAEMIACGSGDKEPHDLVSQRDE